MNTVTRTDIAQHVIEASIAGQDITDEQIDAITDAVLDAAPLGTWHLDGTVYHSERLDHDTFWAIVMQVIG